MGECASGLDLSHPWNYDQPYSSRYRLIVSFVLCCATLPPNVSIFSCLSLQTTVVHRQKGCQSVVI